MQAYLEAIGVWKSIATGYRPPKKVKTAAQKEEKKINSMAMEAILRPNRYPKEEDREVHLN